MQTKRVDMDYMQLRTMVANMSYTALSMLQDTITAIFNQDQDLAEKVILKDKELSTISRRIDRMCIRIVALYSPKALELRYISAVHRVIEDVERIGDNAKSICMELSTNYFAATVNSSDIFENLTALTKAAVNEAVEAFFDQNTARAKKIVVEDKEIDGITKRLIAGYTANIASGSLKAELGIALIGIIRRFERIADHAKNVAGAATYMLGNLSEEEPYEQDFTY